MAEVSTILSVVGLFLLRIGVPVVLLIGLGILVDRWQTKREAEMRAQYSAEQEQAEAETERDEEIRRIA